MLYSSIWLCTYSKYFVRHNFQFVSPAGAEANTLPPLTTSRAKLQRSNCALFVLQVFSLKNLVSRYTRKDNSYKNWCIKSWGSCIRTAVVSQWLLEQEGHACRMITTGLFNEYQLQSLLLAVMTLTRIILQMDQKEGNSVRLLCPSTSNWT